MVDRIISLVAPTPDESGTAIPPQGGVSNEDYAYYLAHRLDEEATRLQVQQSFTLLKKDKSDYKLKTPSDEDLTLL